MHDPAMVLRYLVEMEIAWVQDPKFSSQSSLRIMANILYEIEDLPYIKSNIKNK
jgi:hypothetical protein